MRAGFFFALAGFLAVLPVHHGAAVPAPSVLRYHVNHSTYGNIGTYSNTVEQAGDTTTVLTEAHFRVSLLGMVLHREDARRQEKWQGNRLVSFHGVTTTNGRPLELSGEARGDSFVITSRGNTVTAPADIRPANPWSANFLGSDTMMRVDTGAIERVNVTGGTETKLAIDGATLLTRLYGIQIDGSERYKIWLSEKWRVPVMFSVDDSSGTVTFTLER